MLTRTVRLGASYAVQAQGSLPPRRHVLYRGCVPASGACRSTVYRGTPGEEKRPLLAPNLRNAKREALLGEQWRALTEAEKAQYKVEEAPMTALMAPRSPLVAAATQRVQPLTILHIDAPSSARRTASEAAAQNIRDEEAAAALEERWSIYWNAKRA